MKKKKLYFIDIMSCWVFYSKSTDNYIIQRNQENDSQDHIIDYHRCQLIFFPVQI